jgi:hypothetical protein
MYGNVTSDPRLETETATGCIIGTCSFMTTTAAGAMHGGREVYKAFEGCSFGTYLTLNLYIVYHLQTPAIKWVSPNFYLRLGEDHELTRQDSLTSSRTVLSSETRSSESDLQEGADMG